MIRKGVFAFLIGLLATSCVGGGGVDPLLPGTQFVFVCSSVCVHSVVQHGKRGRRCMLSWKGGGEVRKGGT
jgi:hypothetical protein